MNFESNYSLIVLEYAVFESWRNATNFGKCLLLLLLLLVLCFKYYCVYLLIKSYIFFSIKMSLLQKALQPVSFDVSWQLLSPSPSKEDISFMMYTKSITLNSILRSCFQQIFPILIKWWSKKKKKSWFETVQSNFNLCEKQIFIF